MIGPHQNVREELDFQILMFADSLKSLISQHNLMIRLKRGTLVSMFQSVFPFWYSDFVSLDQHYM
jgi:hypothetical protein